MHTLTRAVATASAVAIASIGALATAATASPDPMSEQMTAVPDVRYVPRTAESYPFSAADHAKVPLHLEDYGFVEKEFFLTGYANVYTTASGELAVERSAVPYTNRILVRHPAKRTEASGVVFVDIYNASNGYDIEDMWRRLYTNILEEGHTYVGVTSKPINVDALYNFDWERYQDLSWYDDDTCEVGPVTFTNPFQEIPCTETGLVWDILTQTGNALRDPVVGRQILGGTPARSIFLIGQSQSSMYLNTYVNNFHYPVQDAVGDNVWDGYLSAAGNWIMRPLNDAEGGAGGLVALEGPAVPVDVDVPWISIDSEADVPLFDGLLPGDASPTAPRDLAENTRVWQIPGTGHTYSMSPVVPDNAELIKAGRPPRTFPTVYTPYPMEPAMIAAGQALIDNHQKGKALPATAWFERDETGALVRDDHNNVLGGVRYGLMELPLAQFLGFAYPGDMNGVDYPISQEEFYENWNNRKQYLAQQRAFDNRLRQQGYLTADGQALFAERAGLVLDLIGITR